MIMYAPFFWAGAQLVCMQLPFNKAPRIYAIRGPMNYACSCFLGYHTIKTCMKPHFWQDPKIVMCAPFFRAGAQLVCMQLPFNQAPGVYAIRGPMNYGCNCLWGQSTNKTCMKPHFRQDPKMIMYAPSFVGRGPISMHAETFSTRPMQ